MRTDILRSLLFCMPFALLISGCSDDNLSIDQNGNDPVPLSGDLYLTLNLSLSDGGNAARTAVGNDEIYRPGKDDENKIKTFHIFFEDLNSDGTLVDENKPRTWFRCERHDIIENGKLRLRINLQQTNTPLTTGLKNVYLGANLTDIQAQCFAENNKPYVLTEADVDKYKYSLTEMLAPGRGIGLVDKKTVDCNRVDMAMFCLKDEENQLNITQDKNEYVCPKTFVMKRNVAKVLVTCETAPTVDGAVPDVKYCNLTGELKDRGWIRQGDVRFLVNALNLKSYIMQKGTWNFDRQDYDYQDPNYKNINQYYIIDENGTPIPQKINQDFYYNAVQTLNKQSVYYVKTLPYDMGRMPTGYNNETCYYEGLYCPENTFDIKDISESDKIILGNYNYPWPMITHVSITTRFTPKDLFVEQAMADYIDSEDGLTAEMKTTIKNLIAAGSKETAIPEELVRIKSVSEEVSWAILTASLKHYYEVQDGQVYDELKSGYPEKTYLSVVNTENKIEFYTYGAALAVSKKYGGWNDGDDKKKLGSFKAMPRGRGYYYTYIDNRKEHEKKGESLTYADSQVERNVYYILRVSSFSTPGRAGSEPEYIKVHTQIAEWKRGGNAEVELD